MRPLHGAPAITGRRQSHRADGDPLGSRRRDKRRATDAKGRARVRPGTSQLMRLGPAPPTNSIPGDALRNRGPADVANWFKPLRRMATHRAEYV
jgi:hypothetical protein